MHLFDQVDQRGTSFKMTASDRDEVTVRLQEPVSFGFLMSFI